MVEIVLGTLLVFVLRVIDVSINTVRVVFVMRGHVGLASVLGFFESATWVVAASVVFSNLGDPIRAFAYAAGFATGVLVGGLVERRLAMGTAFVRVVAPVTTPQVADPLRDGGFPVTVLNAEGRDGEVRVSFLVLPRKRVKEALAVVHEVNPDAFVTVEEVNLPDLERVRRSVTVRK